MKPTILFILHLPPPIHGAAMVGKYVYNSTLLRQEINADFINLSTSTSLAESGKGGIRKIISLLKIQMCVLKALCHKKYDLCYMTLTTTGPGFCKDFFVVLLLKLFGRKIIYHFHNKGIAIAAQQKFNHYLYRFALKNTRCILISRNLSADVENYIERQNVFYCANGIPLYQTNIFYNEGINYKACRLLFFSNMMVEKGVFTLLNACRLLKDKGLLFECHFVGEWMDVSEKMFTDAVTKNNLSDVVFAHGAKYGDEKLFYFNNADVFVFPTYNETFGLVNLEAMQFGLPIVASDEGGIPDIVINGETGFLTPKKDAEKLAEKIEILIRHPELRAKMGVASKKRFYELYTLDKFECRLINILKHVSSGSSALSTASPALQYSSKYELLKKQQHPENKTAC